LEEKPHGQDADSLAFSIVRDVRLHIIATFTDGVGMAGRFDVIGPERPLQVLRQLHRGAVLNGRLSPPSTIHAAHKAPRGAVSCSFVYPIGELHKALAYGMSLATDQWALLLLFGGFAFLDAAGHVLRADAISYVPSRKGCLLVERTLRTDATLQLEGFHGAVLAALGRQRRLVPLHDDELLDHGFVAMSWVDGGELFEGKLLTNEQRTYEHGGFLYTRAHAHSGTAHEGVTDDDTRV
jgi:hypothetical protein